MIARLRRLLVIPAVGLVLLGAPALALDTPAPPEPTTTQVSMADSVAGGPGSEAQAEVHADLVGVKWSGDPDTEFRIEVKRDGGDWEPAGDVGLVDVAPDSDTREGAAVARRAAEVNASEPLWVGDADAVRVVVTQGAPDSVTLAAVDSPDASAPSGSAGALTAFLPSGGDRFGFALALVLSGVVLMTVAVGWTPRVTRRRAAAALAALGLFVVTSCGEPDPPPPPPPAPSGAVPPQPTMTTHAQWGPGLNWNPSPDCAPGPTIASGGIRFAVVHHTVNANTYGPNESAAIVRAIWQYHVKTLGYCDIAYNFLVDRHGQIFEGRMGGVDQAVVAAHTGGFNTGSTGAAWIGDWTSEQPPPAAWDAMVNLLAWKLSVHHADPSNGFTTTSGGAGSRWPAGTVVSFPNGIVGHRDLWPTACPGDAFYPRMSGLRDAVQPKISWPGGPAPITA